MPPQLPRDPVRFGIGEWYGHLLHRLGPRQRAYYAEIQAASGGARAHESCPFRSTAVRVVPCKKVGGVCSVRRYVRIPVTNEVVVTPGPEGHLRAVCPFRFWEDRAVFRWVGATLLRSEDPVIVNEVGFLSGMTEGSNETGDDVGRIDQVLLLPESDPLKWCALEMQAVYFSGANMGTDFKAIHSSVDAAVPFPAPRHPDYRSSGPKRLMPQLQIKVPTLRR